MIEGPHLSLQRAAPPPKSPGSAPRSAPEPNGPVQDQDTITLDPNIPGSELRIRRNGNRSVEHRLSPRYGKIIAHADAAAPRTRPQNLRMHSSLMSGRLGECKTKTQTRRAQGPDLELQQLPDLPAIKDAEGRRDAGLILLCSLTGGRSDGHESDP